MAQLVFANNATSTIAGAITNTSTSVSLQTGEGALFPSPTGGDYFIGSFVDAATGLLTEIVKCTARSGDVLTIVRAQESTSALPWNPGDFFSNLWTAGQAAEMLQQGQVPGSITYYGTDTGSANAIVATMAPALSALATGDLLEITVLHANTSSTVTLNASGVGSHNVYRADGSALAIGDIQASPYVGLFSWNGNTNQFLLLNPATWQETIVYYGTDTGAANAMVATMAPLLSALSVGDILEITALHANTSSTVTLNPSTLGASNVKRADGTALAVGDIQASPYVGLFAWSGSQFLLLNPCTWASNNTAPTIETSGSGTYTTPAGAVRLVVEMVGAGSGGGGGGSGGAASTAGGNTTFGSLTAAGGAAAPASGYGSFPSAATASGGDINIPGSLGGICMICANAGGAFALSGAGGASFFGGGAPSGIFGTTGPFSGNPPNAGVYGSGGGGGVVNNVSDFTGWGGNSGAYLKKTIIGPSATYSYAVGAAGAPGGAGTGGSTGSNAVGGVIIITPYFV